MFKIPINIKPINDMKVPASRHDCGNAKNPEPIKILIHIEDAEIICIFLLFKAIMFV